MCKCRFLAVYSPLDSCYLLGVRVLLINDDVELCALLAELLKREGFDVQMEHDGVIVGAGLKTASTGSSCRWFSEGSDTGFSRLRTFG